MPYNFVADSIQTKKLRSRLSSKVHFLTKTAILRFDPLLGLWETYGVHLKLTRKLVFLTSH